MLIRIDGRDAYAYTGGRPFDASRPTVAFVHGAQHDHSVWILQSRWLAHHGWNVLALDLPGHGRSGGAPLPTVEAMADWTLAFLDTAGATRAHLVGHSMGSLIALEAAGRAPARVASVALVGTAFPMRVSEQLLEAARTDESLAFDLINGWSHSGINHSPGCPGPGFSVFVQNRRLMERQKPGTLLNDFSACNAYANGAARAAALSCPALVVLGTRDVMTPPKAARALASAIADTRVVEIEGAGHALMTERPDEVLDALRRFLDDAAQAAARSAEGAIARA